MATRVTLSNNDGQLFVHKVALSGDQHDRTAEAKWLAEAHHQGVVRLHRFEPDPLTIITEHAGTDTLRTQAGAPAEVAAALAQVCATLAALHSRSLVHGKLTLDHIVLAGNKAVLCSPHGINDDPLGDLADLAQIIDTLLERWDTTETKVLNRVVWEQLTSRLRQESGPYGAKRAIGTLAKLSERRPTPASVQTPRTAPQRRMLGIGVAATFVCLCLAGLFALTPGADPTAITTEFVVGNERFGVGADDAVAVGITGACDEGPVAALLNKQTDTVWGFYAAQDGETGVALATVAGATGIETRETTEGDTASGDACAELWVVGPAGAIRIVPAEA